MGDDLFGGMIENNFNTLVKRGLAGNNSRNCLNRSTYQNSNMIESD